MAQILVYVLVMPPFSAPILFPPLSLLFLPPFLQRAYNSTCSDACFIFFFRNSYRLCPALSHGLSDQSSSGSDVNFRPSKRLKQVCTQCPPILMKMSKNFDRLSKHQPSHLQKRKKCYPQPRKGQAHSYRNVKEQNKWVRENLFDSQGNYLYCKGCILTHFNIHSERLVNQRKIKCDLSQYPVVQLKKRVVTELHLEQWVLAGEAVDCCFGQFWKSLGNEDFVYVKYPYERHGLCGRPSNHAKLDAKEAFLKFIDNNSQPNGRDKGRYSAQFYFLPQFTRIDPPKKGEKGYQEKMKSSVVAQFNLAQSEVGKATISGFTARKWLNEERPKLALCPSMTDYCDTCKEFNENMRRVRTTINRKVQSGNNDPIEIEILQKQLACLEKELKEHKDNASSSRAYYRDMVQICKDDWNKIRLFESKSTLSTHEIDDMQCLMDKFTLVLSIDYQQAKLIPHWGETAQPGLSYYLQKVSHDILGLVDHRADSKMVYLFDERIGPKNTDHTISFLHAYITQVQLEYPWMTRFCIVMDNTCSTNKNRYMVAWCQEMVEQRKFDYVRLLFLVPGHTKFSPDRLFSSIAHTYNKSDVFNIDELQSLCSLHATSVVEDGSAIFVWRAFIDRKYGDVPGIRKLHDIKLFSFNDHIKFLARKCCWDDSFTYSSMHLATKSDQQIQPSSLPSYFDTKRSGLSEQKMSHMKTMYDKWIAPERRPAYLPLEIRPPILEAATSTDSASTSKRKQSHCSTPGCQGVGHKNPQRWSQGHVSRAGCPIFHANS